MSETDVLLVVLDLLDESEVEYMMTGSFASSHYGQPRTTRDLDLVVILDVAGAERIVARIDRERWYVSVERLREAAELRSMANLIDYETGWKVDLVVRKDRPHSRREFERRRRVSLLGREVWMVSPEDLVVAKLEWSAMSGSDRQLDDVRSVLAVQHDAIDEAYLVAAAGELGLLDLLASVREPDAT